MSGYVVGWTHPRAIFPEYEEFDDHDEAQAKHAMALLIDPNATIAPTEENRK